MKPCYECGTLVQTEGRLAPILHHHGFTLCVSCGLAPLVAHAQAAALVDDAIGCYDDEWDD